MTTFPLTPSDPGAIKSTDDNRTYWSSFQGISATARRLGLDVFDTPSEPAAPGSQEPQKRLADDKPAQG